MAQPDLEFVSFTAFHFVSIASELLGEPLNAHSCTSVCSLLAWTRQVGRLASRISLATARRSSVHIWTRCLPPALASALAANSTATSSDGQRARAPIVIHDAHDARLAAALLRIRQLTETSRNRSGASGGWPAGWRRGWPPMWSRGSSALLLLLRWSLVRSSWAELIVSLDLDEDPYPLLPPTIPLHVRRRKYDDWAAHWTSLLRCVHAQTSYSFFSQHDGSSPVNTGFFVLRPSVQIYEEGLRILQGPSVHRYNVTHGWAAVGGSSASVPPSDDAWTVVRRGHAIEMLTRATWQFAR